MPFSCVPLGFVAMKSAMVALQYKSATGWIAFKSAMVFIAIHKGASGRHSFCTPRKGKNEALCFRIVATIP